MAEQSTASVKLTTKSAAFNSALKRVDGIMAGVRARMEGLARAARRTLLVGGAALGGFLKLAAEQERQETKLEAVLKATGHAAGFTAKQLFEQAAALQKLTGIGDETIMAMQAILATFKEIKGDQFKEAEQAIIDMATVLETDLRSAAIQVGKALNDPIQGITALSRSGVSFTQTQKDTIRALVESGNVMQAQGIMLAELKSEFGGAAEAIGKTFHGAVKKALSALGDIGEKIGSIFVPKMKEMAEAVLVNSDRIGEWIERNAGLIKAITGATFAAATLTIGVVAMTHVVSAATIAVGVLTTAFTLMLAHPIVAGLALLAGGLAYLWSVLKKNVDMEKQLEKGTEAYADTARDAAAATDEQTAALGRHEAEVARRAKRVADKEKKAAEEVLNAWRSTREAIATFGLEGTELKIAKLRFRGATPEQLAVLTPDLKKLDLRKKEAAIEKSLAESSKQRAKTFLDEATAIQEGLKTDKQRVQEAKKRVDFLESINLLTKSQAEREKVRLTQSLGVSESIVGRMEDSMSMVRRMAEAAGARAGGGAATPAQQTAQATSSTAKAAEKTAKQTEAASVTLADILDAIRDAVSQLPLVGAFA